MIESTNNLNQSVNNQLPPLNIDDLPEENLVQIFNNLPVSDLEKVEKVSSKWKRISETIWRNKFIEQFGVKNTYKKPENMTFKEFYHLTKKISSVYRDENVVEALGGIVAVDNFPVLDIGGRRGVSDYIDFLKPEDLSAPIMRGVDNHRRAFFAIRYKTNRPDDKGINHFACALFQRYTNKPHIRHIGNNSTSGCYELFEQASITKPIVLFPQLEQFAKGEEITRQISNYEEPIPNQTIRFQLY